MGPHREGRNELPRTSRGNRHRFRIVIAVRLTSPATEERLFVVGPRDRESLTLVSVSRSREEQPLMPGYTLLLTMALRGVHALGHTASDLQRAEHHQCNDNILETLSVKLSQCATEDERYRRGRDGGGGVAA